MTMRESGRVAYAVLESQEGAGATVRSPSPHPLPAVSSFLFLQILLGIFWFISEFVSVLSFRDSEVVSRRNHYEL